MNDSGGSSSQLDPLRIWAVVALLDSGGLDRVPDIARAYLDKHKPADETAAVMARLWAVAASQTGKDLPDVARLLEGFLQKQPAKDERFRTVTSLASIYRKQNRTDDEKALLERELENRETLKAGDALSPLRERLEMIREGGGSGDGPTLAVKAWLKAKTPGWFEFARPRDLNDSKAANPDEGIVPGSSLLPAEAARLCILIAQDATQPEGRRLEATARLGWFSSLLAGEDGEALDWISALIGEKSLARRVRALALDNFLRHAFLSDQRARINKLVSHELLGALREEETGHLRSIRRYAALRQGDLDGALKLGSELLADTMNYFSAEVTQRMIQRLAFAGRLEDAQKLAQGFSSARYQDSIARDKSSYQLTALKVISYARTINPVHAAMRAAYLEKRNIPADTTSDDVPWRGALGLDLTEAEATKVREGWLRDGVWPRDGLDFWFDLTGDLPHSPATEELRLSVLRAGLEKIADDQMRAQLITRCRSFVDIDDPSTRARLEELLKPLRSLVEAPLTRDALREHDLSVRLRIGEAVDSLAALNAISDPRIRAAARWSVLRAFLGNGDKAGLKSLIDSIEVDEMLSPGNAALSAKAYQVLGMPEEAALAMERARESFYEMLLTTWSETQGISARDPSYVLELASRMDDPALIPAAFHEAMAALIKHERRLLFFLSKDAYLHKQWEECASQATKGIARYPTFYDFHGMGGVALARLGQKKAALPLLKAYLDHSHNDPDVPEIRAVFQQAGGEP